MMPSEPDFKLNSLSMTSGSSAQRVLSTLKKALDQTNHQRSTATSQTVANDKFPLKQEPPKHYLSTPRRKPRDKKNSPEAIPAAATTHEAAVNRQRKTTRSLKVSAPVSVPVDANHAQLESSLPLHRTQDHTSLLSPSSNRQSNHANNLEKCAGKESDLTPEPSRAVYQPSNYTRRKPVARTLHTKPARLNPPGFPEKALHTNGKAIANENHVDQYRYPVELVFQLRSSSLVKKTGDLDFLGVARRGVRQKSDDETKLSAHHSTSDRFSEQDLLLKHEINSRSSGFGRSRKEPAIEENSSSYGKQRLGWRSTQQGQPDLTRSVPSTRGKLPEWMDDNISSIPESDIYLQTNKLDKWKNEKSGNFINNKMAYPSDALDTKDIDDEISEIINQRKPNQPFLSATDMNDDSAQVATLESRFLRLFEGQNIPITHSAESSNNLDNLESALKPVGTNSGGNRMSKLHSIFGSKFNDPRATKNSVDYIHSSQTALSAPINSSQIKDATQTSAAEEPKQMLSRLVGLLNSVNNSDSGDTIDKSHETKNDTDAKFSTKENKSKPTTQFSSHTLMDESLRGIIPTSVFRSGIQNKARNIKESKIITESKMLKPFSDSAENSAAVSPTLGSSNSQPSAAEKLQNLLAKEQITPVDVLLASSTPGVKSLASNQASNIIMNLKKAQKTNTPELNATPKKKSAMSSPKNTNKTDQPRQNRDKAKKPAAKKEADSKTTQKTGTALKKVTSEGSKLEKKSSSLTKNAIIPGTISAQPTKAWNSHSHPLLVDTSIITGSSDKTIKPNFESPKDSLSSIHNLGIEVLQSPKIITKAKMSDAPATEPDSMKDLTPITEPQRSASGESNEAQSDAHQNKAEMITSEAQLAPIEASVHSQQLPYQVAPSSFYPMPNMMMLGNVPGHIFPQNGPFVDPVLAQHPMIVPNDQFAYAQPHMNFDQINQHGFPFVPEQNPAYLSMLQGYHMGPQQLGFYPGEIIPNAQSQDQNHISGELKGNKDPHHLTDADRSTTLEALNPGEPAEKVPNQDKHNTEPRTNSTSDNARQSFTCEPHGVTNMFSQAMPPSMAHLVGLGMNPAMMFGLTEEHLAQNLGYKLPPLNMGVGHEQGGLGVPPNMPFAMPFLGNPQENAQFISNNFFMGGVVPVPAEMHQLTTQPLDTAPIKEKSEGKAE